MFRFSFSAWLNPVALTGIAAYFKPMMNQTTSMLPFQAAQPRGSFSQVAGDRAEGLTRERRLVAAAFWVLLSGLLIGAGFLTPDPSGVGTHEQLGLPPCGFHQRTGLPCPTCGMTTAFAWAVRGRIIQAFRIQPAGALGALMTAALWWATGWTALTGASWKPFLQILARPAAIVILLIVIIAAWVYKLLAMLGIAG